MRRHGDWSHSGHSSDGHGEGSGRGMRPPAIFEIDQSAKPGDGERQRNGRKAAGAEEDDEDELMLGADDGRESEALDKGVDYFA